MVNNLNISKTETADDAIYITFMENVIIEQTVARPLIQGIMAQRLAEVKQKILVEPLY